jgi:hypothetical protein
MTETVWGFEVAATSASTQTPTIKFGVTRTTLKLTPTSTNGPVNIAKTMTTMNMNGTVAPFDASFDEKSGTGDVLIGQGTNDTSEAIIPSTVWRGTNAPASAPAAPAAKSATVAPATVIGFSAVPPPSK